MFKVLIMGLPGTGKTSFANKLVELLGEKNKPVVWYNADKIRKMYDDWDFSLDGRLRQAQRMSEKANFSKKLNRISICDFVCPTEYLREVFDADITIWMDTLTESRYKDTNKIFENPKKYDFHITNYNDVDDILEKIIIILTN